MEDGQELNIDMSDFDKFREIIDGTEDLGSLMGFLDRSLKKQITREKNMQYVSKRIKLLVIKTIGKDMKECQKKTTEKTQKKVVKGGINNIYNINNSLCNLLKYPKGSKKSWTQVTKDICKYIDENNLKDPEQKKMIIPNEDLKKCLNIKKTSINMLDLPSYLSSIFKNTKSTEEEDVQDVEIKEEPKKEIKEIKMKKSTKKSN